MKIEMLSAFYVKAWPPIPVNMLNAKNSAVKRSFSWTILDSDQ